MRFVSTSWHSGSQEVKCLVATGMAQVMDALFDDLDDRCMARLEEITVEQVDRKLSGGPCPGGRMNPAAENSANGGFLWGLIWRSAFRR